MINFDKETITPELIDLAGCGACIQSLIERIETHAALQSIDLAAEPNFAGVTNGDHEYRAYTKWTQALYAGLKHHASLIENQGLENAPFIEYATSPSTVFGVSVFLLDLGSNSDGTDIGDTGERDEFCNIEAYDLTTATDNPQADWIDWIRGPEQIACGINTWVAVHGGFELEEFNPYPATLR